MRTIPKVAKKVNIFGQTTFVKGRQLFGVDVFDTKVLH